ncbi:pimeloyl-CoA dehydrogenase small subunit [Croceicoccus ponticola]|uniref:Pimeloyl-CoA dehydrogenase small subunit n=1 Tax=Croceicoccus ponticola TaxID=2217664 RepID=A0A437H208_9SPHN|nr:acyl-CoA dehydrogenase [Croceicoccus ponticola]RVQ69668.1 pimeloyl-CoA dehydrogenase small subunit [Croceicoccus ponticola]
MDFELSEEQRLLKDSVDRLIAKEYRFERRLDFLRRSEGWSRQTWQGFAEMGLLALPFAEEHGGFGSGGVETMLVMEAFGRGLVVEPYLSTVILAGGTIRHSGASGRMAETVERIIAGEHLMALAHNEKGGPRHSLEPQTRAKRSGACWTLTGSKIAVLHGATADELVVSATTDTGSALFLVPAEAEGISVSPQKGYDGVPLAEVTLEGVSVQTEFVLCEPGMGEKVLAHVIAEANAALCAEAVGIMGDVFDTTCEYLLTRTQFGVPIGSFQALQHQAADMLIELELSRSMAILAALSIDSEPPVRERNVSAAKAQIGRSGRLIGQRAIQLHGAIGITEEYKVGHSFKRLTAIDAMFGNADWHIDAIVEAGGLYTA